MILTAFRLPASLLHEVNSISKKLQRTKTFIIRKALETYVKEYADCQIAIDRLNDPQDETISSKEMRGLIAK
ncbi:MAG: DNA-binding protein [Elusimicrobia bacterium]|nr:DNA-binding protein [Elusimicrobiota bacterium]